MRPILLLSVISAIAALSISAAIAAPPPEASIQWAERMLTRASLPPTQPGHVELPGRYARAAEAGFLTLANRYDLTSRAWVGLGRSQALLGQYDDSVRSFQQALNLSPNDQMIQTDLRRAEVYALVANGARKNLPKGQTILRVLQYPSATGGPYWSVLSANVNQQPNNPNPVYTNVYMTLFSGKPNAFTQVWQFENIGKDGYLNGEYNDVQAYAVDMTGDGKLDLIVPEVAIGADYVPSYFTAYSWQNGQMAKLIGVKSQLPVALVDINSDGRYEVKNYYVIGKQVPHVDQPYWSDIYAYRNGTYRMANALFPDQYKQVCAEINQTRRRYPNDPELRQYYVTCNQILRRQVMR